MLRADEFSVILNTTSPPDSLVRWYCFGNDVGAETAVIRDLSRHNADARVLNVEQRMQEEFLSGLTEKHPKLHPLVLPLLAGLEAPGSGLCLSPRSNSASIRYQATRRSWG